MPALLCEGCAIFPHPCKGPSYNFMQRLAGFSLFLRCVSTNDTEDKFVCS